MSEEHTKENSIKKILQGRAAIVGTVVVTVFLCFFTMFEFTALYLEWEIPALKVLTGDETSWFTGDWEEEIALDDSRENVPFSEAGQECEGEREYAADRTENAVDDKQIEKKADIAKTDNKEAEKGESVEDTEEEKEDEAGTESTEQLTEKSEFPYYIRVNRKQNCITIYILDEEGEYTVPYKAMICSTGLYNATPRGIFQISDKYLWRELYGGVYGQYATRIYGGVLFHSVPYYKKAKNMLCTEKYNKLGQQASMGCVRLTVEDAKWIADNCPSGTTVEIYDDDNLGPLGKPEAVKIDTNNPNKGWDPTDPDEENPWKESLEMEQKAVQDMIEKSEHKVK